MYLTLSELKAHLNIDFDFVQDDTLLLSYGEAAERIVERDIDRPLKECESDDGKLVAPLRLACLMLAAHFYATREPVAYGVSVAEVPLTLDYLVSPYRSHKL